MEIFAQALDLVRQIEIDHGMLGAVLTKHLSQPNFPSESTTLHCCTQMTATIKRVGGMISGNKSLLGQTHTRVGPPETHAHVTQVSVLPLEGAFVNF